MPLRLIQRGKWWHVHGTHHGQTVRQAAKTTSEREAEAVKERLEREIYAQVILGQSRKVGFSEAAEGYLAGGSARFLFEVVSAFRDAPVADIRQPDLDREAKRAYPYHAPSTVNRQFYTPFIAVMRYAAEQGWCEARVWRRPSQPPGRTDWRTPEEMEAFLRAAPWFLARNVMIYLGTGMRATEGIKLTGRDIARDGSSLTLWDTKARYERSLEPLSRARPLLADIDGRAILGGDGEPYHAYDALNQAIGRTCEKAGLPAFTCHVMRHTWATWRYAMEKSLPNLMAAGGWKSLSMVQRYAHAAQRDMPERLEVLGWRL